METPKRKSDRALAKFNLRVDALEFSVRASNVLKRIGVKFVGTLVQMTEAEILKEKNCGRTTLSEIKKKLRELNLHLGMYIEDWDPAVARATTPSQGPPIASIRRRHAAVAIAASLEEELLSALKAVAEERDSNVVAKLYGWSGEGQRTLESVGQEYAVTRERIRQIAARTIEKLRKQKFDTPWLTKAVAIVRNNCPENPIALSELMRSSGVSKSNFDPTGLATACDVFGKNFNFDRIRLGSMDFYTKSESSKKINEFFRDCRRLTSSRGCANFDAVCDDLKISDEERGGLRRVAAIKGLYEWLDDEKRWLFALGLQRNRLSNLVSKVLSVCPELSVPELRRAVARSRRLEAVPPIAVLGRFVMRLGLAAVSGDRVVSSSAFANTIETGSVEETMISVLRTHGPVLGWERFQELCVSAGMNPITFGIYLSVSPVVARLARGIYSLVGANVPPGLVEEVTKEVAAARKPVEWGWTARGTLWCALHLTGPVIASGAVSIPTFVANIASGEWQPRFGGQIVDGTIKCKDNFLWGLRRPLSHAGAESDDVCMLEFDVVKRIVDLMVGGEELIDILESGGIELPSLESADAEEIR